MTGKLLFIDNRVNSVETVTNSLLPDVFALVFSYATDTVETILEKIPVGVTYDSLGVFQENYAAATYQLVDSMQPCFLDNDSSWEGLIEFYRLVKEKTGIAAIDLMGCNIGADANWTRVIGHIETSLGVSVASSVDATGGEAAGGNWILETENVDLVGKYFTEGIREYQFILGFSSSHTLLLTGNREVYAAGSNTSGCCGLGSAYNGYSTVSEFLRVPVSGISGVSYSTNTSYLLTASANVLVCGANANGQLGLGNTTAQTDLSFVRTDATTRLANVSSVAAGGSHTVFLLTDGSALACGLNTSGQLGDGTLTQRTFPVAMNLITLPPEPTAAKTMYYPFDNNATNQIGGANGATSNVTYSNTVYKVGTHSIRGIGNGYVDLATFTLSSTTITVSFFFNIAGNATGWVWISYNGVGYYAIEYNHTDSKIRLSTPSLGFSGAGPVIATVSQGVWYHIAIVNNSSSGIIVYLDGISVYTNASSQFTESTYSINRILGFPGSTYSNAYVDDFIIYSTDLTQSDISLLVAKGSGPTATPITLVSSIATGDFHSLVSRTDGTAFSAGLNTNGQLGIGNTTSQSYLQQVKTAVAVNLTGVSQVAAGGSHSLALTSTGTVYAWGANAQGQLGINTNVDASYATLVLTPAAATLTNITQVAAGTSHSLFLTASGTVFACGLNTSGQLGNNTTTSSNQLVSVLNPAGTAALSNISRISATANTSFFLNASGILFACGSNAQTQMGFPNSGATTFYTLPVQISIVDFGRAKAAGFTPYDTRLLGAEPWHQQYYGEQTLNLSSAGYSSTALSNSGITSGALKAAGLTSSQVAALGFAEEQAYPPSFITTTASLAAVSANFTKRGNGNFVQSITSAIHNTKFYDMSGSSHFVSGDSVDLPPSAFSSTQVWRTELLWNTTTGAYTGATTTTMSGTSYSGEWVQIRLPVAIKLSSYTFTPSVGRTPVIFYLGGSLDGTTWTLLDSKNTATTGGSANRFTLSTMQFFNYYRLVVNTIQTSNDGYLALNRFQLNTTSNVSKTVISLTDLSLSGYDAMEMIASGVSINSLNSAGISLTNPGSFTVKQLANAGFSYGDIIRNTNLNIVKVGQASLTGSKIGTLMSGGLLDAPRGVSVSGRTANSISVGITAPSFSSGLTGYSVSAVPVNGGTTVNKSLGVGGTLVGDLSAGKIYDLNVRSVSAGGNSTALTVRNSTAASLPTLTAGTTTTTSIQLLFSTPLAAQDCSYVLRNNINANQFVLAVGDSSRNVTGLNESTSHIFTLDASNIYTIASTTLTASTTAPVPVATNVETWYASDIFTSNTQVVSGQTPTYRNGTYVASASSVRGTFFPYLALNKSTSTFYHAGDNTYNSNGEHTGGGSTTNIASSSNISGEWIQIQLPYKLLLKSTSLMERAQNNRNRLPYSFVIVGSNNGINWNILYQQTQPATAYVLHPNLNTMTVSGVTVAYSYIRLITRKTSVYNDPLAGGADSSTTVNITQWNLTGDIYLL